MKIPLDSFLGKEKGIKSSSLEEEEEDEEQQMETK